MAGSLLYFMEVGMNIEERTLMIEPSSRDLELIISKLEHIRSLLEDTIGVLVEKRDKPRN